MFIRIIVDGSKNKKWNLFEYFVKIRASILRCYLPKVVVSLQAQYRPTWHQICTQLGAVGFLRLFHRVYLSVTIYNPVA